MTTNDFEARREAILQDALKLARQRRQRRTATRVSLAVLPLVIVAVFVSLRRSPPPPIAIAPPDTRLKLERIADDPTILDRYRLVSKPSTIERISDDTLLADLREANIPGGIATIGDQTYVLLQNDSLDTSHE